MHRTPLSLKGRLDTNNLRTSETSHHESINELWDNAYHTKNENYALLWCIKKEGGDST